MDIPIDLIGLALPENEALPTAPSTDGSEALIAEACAGSEAAFRELVLLHQDAIHRFCFHWLRDEEDAQEICQDTFLRAWYALDRYERRGRFSAWLYRIALNLCRDRHKSKGARQRRDTHSLEKVALPLTCPRPAPDEALAQTSDVAKLQRGIAALPESLRTVLILSAQEGLSHEACAEILHCSARAVEGRLYRARRELLAWWKRTD